MAKIITPLTDIKVNNAKPELKDYKLFDGGGLFLLVKKNGVKSWRMKYKKPDGKESTIVFGNYPLLSLRDARAKREETKEQLLKNKSPQQEREKKQATLDVKDTFDYMALDWIEQTATNKRWSPDYKLRVTRAIQTYLFPRLSGKRVSTITTRELIAVEQRVIDAGVIDVARRTKEYLITIMRHALFKGLIEVNPALDLQGITIEAKTKHRATIPYTELQELIAKINGYKGHVVTKYALLINLHLFMRASELTYSLWSEIDLTKRIWTIPETREPVKGVKYSERGAKMKTEHIVPLSDQVITLLMELKQITGNTPFVFSINNKTPITSSTPRFALRYLGYDKQILSFHGFRTLACSALVESGLFTKDAIERQMSHMERNGVRAAYINKAEHLKERIALMQWWSDYLDYVKDNGYIAPYDFKGS